jgi:hypothetical protein
MTGKPYRSCRSFIVAGLALSGFLFGAPRHAWSQG